MTAEVKILIEGETNANEVGETGEKETRPTITLVRDGDIVMVVDPGILKSQQILVDALKNENLTVKDVNFVCITHSHVDHYRNAGMFPNAKILEYFGLWEKESVEEWHENFSENIQILRTPGHDYTSITLFVRTAPDSEHPGIVAICGDIFWKENYPANPQDDAFASNPAELEHSREMVLKTADWIVPGHSGIYKNMKIPVPNIGRTAGAVKLRELKIISKCKKCKRVMEKNEKCMCRPWFCFRCCECGLDCDLCICSHKNKKL